MFKKTIVFIMSLFLHLIALGLIFYAFYPMAKWYFDAKPFWGVDFYYTVTLVNFLQQYPVLPQLGWNSIWFAGWPLLISYPLLHYYLLLPLVYFVGLISGVKLGLLISSFLFFSGSYFCFYQLSKSRALSIILSIVGIYSVGTYGAIMWGGSLPNFATQAFFPWTILFIIKFINSKKNANLLVAGALSGFSILGHPQITIAYIIPSVFILIGFTFNKLGFAKKIQSGLIFIGLTIFIGLPMLTTTFISFEKFLQSAVVTDAYKNASSTVNIGISQDVIAFHKEQPFRIIKDTHPLLFLLIGVSFCAVILSLIFKRRLFRLLQLIPYILLTLYFIGYIVMYSYGISFYHGGWYRLFWSVPFWAGLVASSLWGAFYSGLTYQFNKYAIFFISIFEIVILLSGGFIFYTNTDFNVIKQNIINRSITSSAFPDVVNMPVSLQDRNKIKNTLVPSWLPADSQDYRLYSSDQTVNIWWNSFFKMPLSRGYFDPLDHEYFFWLDASLSQDTKSGDDQLVGSFKYPPRIALNNTLFLIDWYAVKYFEAGHSSPTVFAPLAKSLSSPEYIANETELDFNSVRYSQTNQKLHYYSAKDELVSPILIGSNAPTLCVITTDRGFDTINRSLADAFLNLNTVIPIKLNNKIDMLSDADLKMCQSLILYDYDYRNQTKAFNLIRKYIESGKKVFIDTGMDVKDANNQKLTDIFPFTSSSRKPLGSTWDFEVQNSSLTQNINFNLFDPPLFDQEEWNFSYPKDNNVIRKQAQIILKNHDKPIMMLQKFINGEVVWSGMNLPYHVIRTHNEEEVKFFKQITLYLIGEDNKTQPIYQTKFISPQKREIETTSRSVIFKEMAYSGWRAEIISKNKRITAKIYPAGPAYPGFMYVNIPQEYINQQVKVIFSYHGSLINWGAVLVSFITTFIAFDVILFKGKIIFKQLNNIKHHLKTTISHWWNKEEDII